MLLACALLTAGPSEAADGVLVFDYIKGGVPPFVMDAPEGATGITFDILTHALRHMGWKLRVVFHPEMRGKTLLDRGEVDARGKAREWVANPEDYYWSEPFLTPCDVLVSSADAPVAATRSGDLQGRTIVCIHGYFYPALDEAFRRGAVNRMDVDSGIKQMHLVDKGRADAAIMDEDQVRWLLRTDPHFKTERFVVSHIEGSEADYRLMFSKSRDWRPFIRRFNEEIRRMRADGTIEAICAKYR